MSIAPEFMDGNDACPVATGAVLMPLLADAPGGESE